MCVSDSNLHSPAVGFSHRRLCDLRHRVSMEAASSLSLKRRYEEVDNSSPFSTSKDSDDEISSSDSADSCDSLNPPSSTAFTRKEPQKTDIKKGNLL